VAARRDQVEGVQDVDQDDGDRGLAEPADLRTAPAVALRRRACPGLDHGSDIGAAGAG
jgi:hypothetical protein